MKFIFQLCQKPPWLLILFLWIIQKSIAQEQPINTTQLQSDVKGLKAMDQAKIESVEVKIDPVKKEMRDFMRECGVDVPEEEDAKGNVELTKGIDKVTNTNKLGNLNMAPMVADNLNDGRKKKKKKGTYPTSYGNSGSKRKNKKRRGNNDCDDDFDDSCEDDDDDSDSDEDDDDRRRGKGKKGRGGQQGGRNRRDTSTLVEQFNVTDGREAIDEDNTEMNESFKDKKNKRRGGSKRGGNRDYDEDEDEEDDDDDAPSRCGGGGRNKGGGRGKGKNRGGQGGGGGDKNKKKGGKGGRGGSKGGGGKKHGGGGDDGFGGEDGQGHGGGNPFDTGAGLGPGMGDNYGYPGLSGSGYFHGNPYGYGSYSGYIRQLGDSEVISRIKRQEDKNECVSQCVFGYLEVLDDNRVPSETALISYYQEKITNNVQKSETIRNVRRCFARLVATDTEDGCKFSKEVSKCMKLELDP